MLPFNPKLHSRIVGNFSPEADGLTFHIKAVFTDTLRNVETVDHAKGEPIISRICGPVAKVNDSTFTVRFYRMGFNNERRTNDIWLLASHPGDGIYKSTVQQLNIRIPLRNKEGAEQLITFGAIPDIKQNVKSLTLTASSNREMPVFFYIQEGPAEVIAGKLVISKIPPRSRFPIKITVVAWQYGRASEPKIQTASPVYQSFNITK